MNTRMQKGYLRIPDESVTSSSVLTQDGVTYGAYRRVAVGQKRAGPYGDSWCAATAGQYIQVQLGKAVFTTVFPLSSHDF